MRRLLTGGIRQNTKHGGHITYGGPEGLWKKCVCVRWRQCQLQWVTPLVIEWPHDSQWGLNLLRQGDWKSPFFLGLFTSLSFIIPEQPTPPSKTEFNICVWKSFCFFLMLLFFFFPLRKVVDAVWVSRVAFKAGNAYSWPVCFLCTVSLCLHPFGPFRFYQQFYPSWMPLYVVEEYCFKMTTIWGKKGADIKVHTHYIKGVTVRTKTLNRVAGNCKMHTSFDQAIKCYDKVNTPEY